VSLDGTKADGDVDFGNKTAHIIGDRKSVV
jgi:hypothetical protein